MILSIVFFTLAVICYSISQLQQHGKLIWRDDSRPGTFWSNSSWVRKYKNIFPPFDKAKFPGSTTLLSFLTDGYHLMQFCFKILFPLSVAFYQPIWTWYYDAGLYWLIFSATHHYTYKWLSR